MTYVERRIVLRNGPPWGFDLYEHPVEGLLVTNIRRQSPAAKGGLHEGDLLLAINSVDSRDISEYEALQLFNFASYTVELFVGRFEVARKSSIVLDSASLRARQPSQELSTTELQLFWEKGNPLKPVRDKWPPPAQTQRVQPQRYSPARSVSPPPEHLPIPKLTVMKVGGPPKAQPKHQPLQIRSPPTPTIPSPSRRVSLPPKPQEKLITPHDPDVSRISVNQLMSEYNAPPIAPQLKKKNYADSTFYNAANNYYPTIEEQIEMARKVAKSLHDPYNVKSRGANIFERQRLRANKHVREGPDPVADPVGEATSEQFERIGPLQPPPPPPPPPPSFPGLGPELPRVAVKKPTIPGQPKTMQEYLEKVQTDPKSNQSEVDPQKCFDIASALYTTDGRGSKMFQRRFARARKWAAEEDSGAESNFIMEPSGTAGSREANRMAKVSNILDHSKETGPIRAPVHAATLYNKPVAAAVPMEVAMAHRKPSISLEVDEPRRFEPPKLPDSINEALTPLPFSSADFLKPADDRARRAPSPSVPSKLGTSGPAPGWRPVKFKVAQDAAVS